MNEYTPTVVLDSLQIDGAIRSNTITIGDGLTTTSKSVGNLCWVPGTNGRYVKYVSRVNVAGCGATSGNIEELSLNGIYTSEPVINSTEDHPIINAVWTKGSSTISAVQMTTGEGLIGYYWRLGIGEQAYAYTQMYATLDALSVPWDSRHIWTGVDAPTITKLSSTEEYTLIDSGWVYNSSYLNLSSDVRSVVFSNTDLFELNGSRVIKFQFTNCTAASIVNIDPEPRAIDITGNIITLDYGSNQTSDTFNGVISVIAPGSIQLYTE